VRSTDKRGEMNVRFYSEMCYRIYLLRRHVDGLEDNNKINQNIVSMRTELAFVNMMLELCIL